MLLFDRRCPGCGVAHRLVCRACLDQCELLAPRSIESPTCADRATLVVPLFRYDDVAARLVLAGKNGGRRDLLRWMAGHLADRVQVAAPPIESVTWVPAHPRNRRRRRFDQAEVVASTVARQLDLPSRRCLDRIDRTSRRGLDRSARLTGPAVTARRKIDGPVLLVDDVMATGATLGRCVDTLQAAGATAVVTAVLAISGDDVDPRSSPSVTSIVP